MSNILIKFFFFFFFGAPLLSHYGWLNGKYGKGRKEKEKKNMCLDVKEKRRESEKCILHFYPLKL